MGVEGCFGIGTVVVAEGEGWVEFKEGLEVVVAMGRGEGRTGSGWVVFGGLDGVSWVEGLDDGIERKGWIVVIVIVGADVGEWVGEFRSGVCLGFSVGGVGVRVGYSGIVVAVAVTVGVIVAVSGLGAWEALKFGGISGFVFGVVGAKTRVNVNVKEGEQELELVLVGVEGGVGVVLKALEKAGCG
jgi:hypothetical protein